MTKQRKINVAERLIQVSKNLLDPDTYLKNRKRRDDLAGYYKEFISLGGQFPQLPGSRSVATQLQKRVSSSCPACVSEYNMKLYIESAISFIVSYGKKLEEMVEHLDSPKKSVHDLKPTNN